ncbi:MAG TPA: VCBS repeat-containing protein [bacterium]|nr:VCBS repeat-containing protein [bacterium]
MLEHMEAPGEIALGTMAVRFWASLRSPHPEALLAGATLVFGEGDAAGSVEMRPLDGAFDSPEEDVVATVDTYAWVRDGAHEWRLRAASSEGAPEIVGQGAIRVKDRISTPDLVLFDSRGGAHAWIGSGAGGFTPSESFESGPPGFPPLLADADGDRLPDVIWPTTSAQSVVVWKNRGGGRFEPYRTLPLDAEPVAGAVADLDGDGKPDLVTVTSARVLEIRQGIEEPPTFSAALTLAPERLAVTDLDGDGSPEICVALLGLQDGEVQVWSRDSKAGWLPTGRLEAPSGGRGRVLRMVGAPAGRTGLMVLSGDETEGRLESWGSPADTESESGPVCRTRYRVAGEPLELLAGRFAEDAGWLLVVREGARSVLYGVRERDGVRKMGSLEGVPGTVGTLDLDGDGDDDLVTGGADLRLWINVRGTDFREAGESPYLLDASVVALVAGNLDERGS